MIELHQVDKAYKGLKALNQLSLNIPAGQIYGLLGANGAGKSTTIQLLLGFLKPDAGRVRVHGFDPVHQASQARAQLGYIPENVQLYPYLSGLENLDYFCRLANLKYRSAELLNILATCGLQAEAHHAKVANYSKGMRQKVGIAIAYAKKAKVYLLDEPASGLDPVASNELSVLLKQLASNGAAVLMASHDLFRVREVCHQIGMLKKGELVKQLRSDEVTALELEQLYLDYMKN